MKVNSSAHTASWRWQARAAWARSGALGMTAFQAGLAMLPNGLVIMVTAPLAGRLTDRLGARWILVGGLSLMGIGILILINQISVTTSQWSLVVPLLITGLGMGMTFAPMTAAAMAQVPLAGTSWIPGRATY